MGWFVSLDASGADSLNGFIISAALVYLSREGCSN